MIEKDIIFFDKNKTIHLILKLVGSSCNINCTYCFEKSKNLFSTESINKDTLIEFINKIENQIVITLHGGEPLIIGKKKIIELLDLLSEFYPNKITNIYLQTNGILLDDEWIYILFKKYKKLNIEISISLDGSFEMNSLRVNYNNQNTYNDVLSAYRLLSKNNINAGMLSVISKHSLNSYVEYIELIKKIDNLKFVKINPLFNIENNDLSKDSITPTEFAQFIINVANLYIKEEMYKKIAIEPILSMIQKINNKESKYCNYNGNKCYQFISLYPNGLIAPCDCFSSNEFEININGNLSFNENIINAVNEHEIFSSIINDCKNCNIFDFCNAGCISQRCYFRKNKYLYNNYCESKKMLYSFSSKFKV